MHVYIDFMSTKHQTCFTQEFYFRLRNSILDHVQCNGYYISHNNDISLFMIIAYLFSCISNNHLHVKLKLYCCIISIDIFIFCDKLISLLRWQCWNKMVRPWRRGHGPELTLGVRAHPCSLKRSSHSMCQRMGTLWCRRRLRRLQGPWSKRRQRMCRRRWHRLASVHTREQISVWWSRPPKRQHTGTTECQKQQL